MPAFRTVWTATLVANIGAWMASVGTGWLMTTLDPSPIWVSLVGAATALPMFLFALPAGALADIVDRRKLLIVAQIFMLAVMVVLCVLTMMGAITPVTLLILIFVLEAGSAFETPAFLAVLPELVPKDELSQALALNGLGINISRVLGPALRQKVAQLDWHNDASRLILDINDALTAATDEKARGVVIRRLRRALNEVAPPVPPAN